MNPTQTKAVKIQGQLHAINHNTMRGYRTDCGKIASFGHSVSSVQPDALDCPVCRAANQGSKQ